MPGSEGQGLRDRRRRTAALLSRSIKEAARAPVGIVTAEVKRSVAQSSPVAPEAKPVPVVQAERVPDQEPGCIKQLLEYLGCGSEGASAQFSVDASFKININRDQHAE